MTRSPIHLRKAGQANVSTTLSCLTPSERPEMAGSSPSLPDGSNPSAAIVQSASDVQCSRLLKTTIRWLSSSWPGLLELAKRGVPILAGSLTGLRPQGCCPSHSENGAQHSVVIANQADKPWLLYPAGLSRFSVPLHLRPLVMAIL